MCIINGFVNLHHKNCIINFNFLQMKFLSTYFIFFLFITAKLIGQNNQKLDTNRTFYSLSEAFMTPNEVIRLDLSFQKLNFDTIDLTCFINLKHLSISHDGIQTMPLGITKLSNLKSLDLSANNLNSIPIEFLELKSLEELYLNNDYNLNIESSLNIISKMKSLKSLHLDSLYSLNNSADQSAIYNIEYLTLRSDNLVSIPAFVKRFKNLKVLDLAGNKITNLDDNSFEDLHIEELSLGLDENFDLEKGFNSIKSLQDLKTLHLDNTPFERFPTDLSSVKNIEYLSLKNDHFSKFPQGIITLPNLKTLDLSGNDFEDLPEDIYKLENLEELYLSDDFNLNIKSTFDVLSKMPKLKLLHLDNISINKLPVNFKKLTHLEAIYLQDGQFFMLPNEKHTLKNLSRVDLRNTAVPVNGNNHNGFGLRLKW